MVEFILIAPLLILIFFAVLQLAYTGLTALAVQRAALAIAREASLSADKSLYPSKSLRTLVLKMAALAPLTGLNRKATWACIACTRYEIRHDRLSVTADVHYPMPIWVPGVGRWFGEPLVPSLDLNGSEPVKTIRDACRLLGLPEPDLAFAGVRLPFVRWMDSSATVFNESAAER